MSPKNRTRDKDALISGVLSFFLMGAGQLRNKQKGKALFFFSILLMFILIELLTGSYQYFAGEAATNPIGADGRFYFFRDYGGMFTRGIWGLVSLGALVINQQYRGATTVTFNKNIPWLSADNSVSLLIAGLIAVVILSVLIAVWIIGIRDAYRTRKMMNDGTFVQLSGKAYLKELYDDLLPLLLLIPIIVLVGMFTIIPVLFSFLLAFTNYTYRIMPPTNLIRWVGFENFARVVSDPAWFSIFGRVLLWTILFAIMASVTCYALGFINALVIEGKNVKAKKFWRTILIIPWAVPGMISLMVFKNAFDTNGLINKILYETGSMQSVSQFLYNIGLQGQADSPIYWFSQAYNGNLAKAVVILVNLWLGAPYFMMLITGTLTTIPKDLYEAASIDGATGWKKFQNITLPLVLRGTAPAIIMTFTHNFNNFGSIFYLTGGGPTWVYNEVPTTMRVMGGVPGQTDILISWIFKLSFTQNAQLYNVAAVYSILIFIFVAIFSVMNLSRNKAVWEE